MFSNGNDTKAEFWITQQTRERYKAIESVLAVLLRQHAESIIESLNRSPARRNFEKPIGRIVFLFGKFFASFNMAILEKESLLRCIETSHDILSASSFYASIFERLDQPRRRRTLVPYF